MEYRQVTKEDIPSIDKINRGNMPENYNQQTYEIHIDLAPTLNWIAAEDNSTTGYIITQIQDKVEAHITSIAVNKEYRRQGIGKMLMLKMLIAAKKRKLLSCSLHVRISNKGAVALYESLKFNKVRQKKGYYEDGEDAYLMRRRL